MLLKSVNIYFMNLKLYLYFFVLFCAKNRNLDLPFLQWCVWVLGFCSLLKEGKTKIRYKPTQIPSRKTSRALQKYQYMSNNKSFNCFFWYGLIHSVTWISLSASGTKITWLANSEDPDQTISPEAAWSGSTLVQISNYLG